MVSASSAIAMIHHLRNRSGLGSPDRVFNCRNQSVVTDSVIAFAGIRTVAPSSAGSMSGMVPLDHSMLPLVAASQIATCVTSSHVAVGVASVIADVLLAVPLVAFTVKSANAIAVRE